MFQSDKSFPLDCETLSAIQDNATMLGILGMIAGDKVIMSGCELSSDGIKRSEGYVYIKTADYPEGEVLRWEGGATTSGMYVRKRDVSVSALGNSYPKAYTVRSLAPGLGEEHYSWDEFTELTDMPKLKEEIKMLATAISGLTAPPLGIVEMWSGEAIPEGHALCDGHQLLISEYPELYGVLGERFNTACSASGTKYSTTAGYFRLPDLRGRFVVGYHDTDKDYSEVGLAGGIKSHTLTEDELPGHRHEIKDYVQKPNGSNEIYEGDVVIGEETVSAGGENMTTNLFVRSQTATGGDGWMQYLKHKTEEESKVARSHENRPPFYVLAYIMRVK